MLQVLTGYQYPDDIDESFRARLKNLFLRSARRGWFRNLLVTRYAEMCKFHPGLTGQGGQEQGMAREVEFLRLISISAL